MKSFYIRRKNYKKARFRKQFARFLKWCEDVGL